MRRELGRKRVVQDQLLSRFRRRRSAVRVAPPAVLCRRAQTICFGCCLPARCKPSHAYMAPPSVHSQRPCCFKTPGIRCRSPRSASRIGGPGLRSAIDAAPSAYRAPWADCLPTIRARAPLAADRLVQPVLGADARTTRSSPAVVAFAADVVDRWNMLDRLVPAVAPYPALAGMLQVQCALWVQRAPPPLRAFAAQGWWSVLSDAASHPAPLAAQLPTGCREAAAHAAVS